MGQGDSKQIVICPYCASEIVPPDDKENGKISNSASTANNNEHKSNHTDNHNNNNNNNNSNDTNSSQSQIIPLPPNLCPRCHGTYRKTVTNSPHRRRVSSLFGNSDNNTNTTIQIHI